MPHSTMPAITINSPDSIVPKPRLAVNSQESAASNPKSSEVESCYLCDEQNPGDFSPTTKFLDGCLLCNRSFCPIHKGQWEHVCNINHSTYYHEHPAVPDLYPSLGEREKMLFMSPTTLDDSTKRAIDAFRGAEASDLPKSKLIEEKDLVGADVAV